MMMKSGLSATRFHIKSKSKSKRGKIGATWSPREPTWTPKEAQREAYLHAESAECF